jgi:hypothetical protein
MRNSVMHRVAKIVRSKSKRSFAALKEINGAHLKIGLVAAALFALVYAVETKAILVLESSQNPFEVMRQSPETMYR